VKDNALERIMPGAPDLWAQVYHAVHEEWALTAERLLVCVASIRQRSGRGSPQVSKPVRKSRPPDFSSRL
jgi:hypothetical protein